MKKIKTTGILIMVIVMIIAFASCGEKNKYEKYIGNYKCVKAEMAGMELSSEELGEIKIQLKDDGKAVFTFDEESENVTWDVEEEEIIIKADDGDESLEFKCEMNDKDDGFKIPDFMGMGLEFEKEK